MTSDTSEVGRKSRQDQPTITVERDGEIAIFRLNRPDRLNAFTMQMGEELRAAFLSSPWANRSPTEVEVPFETVIGGIVVRGRIDAVFAEKDGSWTVVDWKTGVIPEPARRESLFIQLAAYRLAWAQLAGVEPTKVRAAFHYVRDGHTLEADDLPDEATLAAKLAR